MNLGNAQPVGANLLARRWHCVIRNTASRTSSLLLTSASLVPEAKK